MSKELYDKVIDKREGGNYEGLKNTLRDIVAIDDAVKGHMDEVKSLKKKKESIISAMETLGLKLSVCRNCNGSGVETYTCGYQDGCTASQECSECDGTGYAIERAVKSE